MPTYEFFCPTCKKEVELTATMSERQRGDVACPDCGGKRLEPLMTTFVAKTSRKF